MAAKRFGGTEKNGKSDPPVGVPGHTASSQVFRHAQNEPVWVALRLKIGLTIASIYRIDIYIRYIGQTNGSRKGKSCAHVVNHSNSLFSGFSRRTVFMAMNYESA
jgi:hypothetical protein